jgi:hypothetical protein
MFADPARLDTDGDADGEAEAFGDTDGEADALGVADGEALTVGRGVAVAVTVTEGVTVSVTVGVGEADAVGDELVFTLLPLQPVAIIAMQATRARLYRNRAEVRIVTLPFFRRAIPPRATAATEVR